MTVRPAVPDDARGIAEVQVQTWRVAYAGIVDDEELDALSVDERTRSFRAWLGGSWSARHFVADEDGVILAFYAARGFAPDGAERNEPHLRLPELRYRAELASG